MTVFVDTSALLAVVDAGDDLHAAALEVWKSLLLGEGDVVTTNSVLLEALSLVQARMGFAAARTLETEIVPALAVHWVDEALHRSGAAVRLAARRRRLSLVDCVSFEHMRRSGIRHAFGFDKRFREQGFAVIA